ncbi:MULTISPECIES: mechanosensitive ion channel family protein [Desulfococcus]|jgi:small-conductance mechanosensitive channel|uniref:MscS Mechanosensitive ion channel n=1 Tax=Desulfococcus multivorans DSM 2059 TaxID=1121405 RepID=S7TM68_DESML|nr:mechanosensitive ion channel family protein [Desulfococcus multivorans]AOY58267.1 mscS1: mechanosensitive ion channel [Desulfococcus multivorans]AQV00610.1 mechanosensitive ion channel protein MscS [Desulfococcus multivorans]EPR37790.1 MscS Mechanosensitive ion channel [Desulfococcus multivorans DSM 2059]MDX9818297.1 mechanosensitive ion channel family protein [Desulfococcus multivorans]SJZ97827.1 Small-conductance mechanosensitive channel [Desulfococcus multivorans DSM 2059]
MARTMVMVLALFLAAAGGLQADELKNLLTGTAAETQAPAEKVITTRSSTQNDRNIRQRLDQIFSELDALRDIEISVSNGVVTLKGEVDSVASETKALQFTRQVEGVVEVVNELTVNRDLSDRLSFTWQKIVNMARSLAAQLPLFVLALLLLVMFWMLGGWIRERESLFLRVSPNPFIAGLLGQIAHLVFILAGVIVALVLVDAAPVIGTILGAAGIVGLAVGFAVRDTVENYIASILLSLRNPFEVNDLVDIDGHEGNVARITSRATILISLDGNHIRIPNALVFKAVITNFTRNPERRFHFKAGIDTAEDLLAAQALALETLKATPGVLTDPRPLAVIEALGDSNVLLGIYAWVDQRRFSFPKVRSEAIRRIKEAFDDAGIVMPEPIYKLRLIEKDSHKSVPVKKSVDANAGDVKDVKDVSAEHALERKVLEDQAQGDGENLLTKNARQEL